MIGYRFVKRGYPVEKLTYSRIYRKRLLVALLASAFSCFFSCGKPLDKPLVFNAANSSQPLTESTLYNRAIVWRPADGATVSLNPPRFSWPYEPTIMLTGGDSAKFLPVRHYRFQLSIDSTFDSTLVDIPATPFNFYNTLAPLPSGKKIYWRVGYYDPDRREELDWSRVRSFAVTEEATVWDRSNMVTPAFVSADHPRIIYTKENIEALRKLRHKHPFSREIYEKVLAEADADLEAAWFKSFPRADTIPEKQLRELLPDIPPWLDPDGGDAPYLIMIERLMNMAFAFVLTGEEKYLDVAPRLVTVAEYAPGGQTSPEGLGGSEDNVALNEYLSLFYDWFYNHLPRRMRNSVLESLRWRTEHIVNNYSWRQRQGTRVYPHSIAVCGSSHPFENINYTVPAGLAAYEEGGVFRTTFDLAVNYYSGVNNPFGPEDAWNEGPGYGLSKFKWESNAISYYDMSLNEANFGLNPFLTEIGEFFTRVAVMGMPHLSFGNIGIMEPYYLNNRVSSFRKLAYLTGNRRFLTSWEDALRRLEQIGYSTHRKYFRRWIEYALPFYYAEPEQLPAAPMAKIFPDGGWVTAATAYPGELDNFANSVGIIFRARPRGAFNHSFFSDNGFQIYAFGQNVTHGGGSTRNGDRHAHHSMSHNIVLVDGLGQAQPSHARLPNFRLELFHPYTARIERFAESGGTVYAKGEAVAAYVQYPYRYREFWGFLGDGTHNPYDERDLSYLTQADRHLLFVDGRYFVMLDELDVDENTRPEGSRFSWLYHVLQDVPLEWDESSLTFTYRVADVTTVVYIASDAPTDFEDRQREDGLINPLTGEDYNPHVRRIELYDSSYAGDYPELVIHNVWITNRVPVHRIRFLSVIYPVNGAGPAPQIERIDELTVRISRGELSQLVTFDPSAHPEADVQVEL